MATLDDTVNNINSTVNSIATAVGTLAGQITQPTVDFSPVTNLLGTNQVALLAALQTVTDNLAQVLTQLQPTPAATPTPAPTDNAPASA